jgi:hypothetical protein
MIKKLVLSSALVALMTPVLATTIKVDELQYKPKDQRSEVAELATLVFEGERIPFAGKEVVVTEGLDEALEYIDTQEHMTELRKDTMRGLAYSAAFIIQNATNSVTLQGYTDVAGQVATCGYFQLDKKLQFTIEKIYSKIVESDEEKARFIAGSFELADLMPLYTDPRSRQDDVMMCSEKMSNWLPK